MAKNMAPKVYFVAVRNSRRNTFGIFHKDDVRLTYAVMEKYGPFTRLEAQAFQLPGRYIVSWGLVAGKGEKAFDSIVEATLFKASIVDTEENVSIFDRAAVELI